MEVEINNSKNVMKFQIYNSRNLEMLSSTIDMNMLRCRLDKIAWSNHSELAKHMLYQKCYMVVGFIVSMRTVWDPTRKLVLEMRYLTKWTIELTGKLVCRED